MTHSSQNKKELENYVIVYADVLLNRKYVLNFLRELHFGNRCLKKSSTFLDVVTYNIHFDVIVRRSTNDPQQDSIRFGGDESNSYNIFLHFRSVIFWKCVRDYPPVWSKFVGNGFCGQIRCGIKCLDSYKVLSLYRVPCCTN